MSLRTRIAFVVAGSVAVAVLVISGITLFAARAQARRSLDDSLQDRAAQVQVGGGRLPGRGRGELIFGRFVPDDVLVQVIDDRGQILEGNVDPLPVDADDIAVANGRRRTDWSDVEVDGVRLRVLTVEVPGPRAVMLARPLSEVDETIRRLRTVVALVAGVGVVVAGGVGFLVAGRAIRPVRRLTDAASSVAETQDFDHPIDVERDDELGQLARSFNAMLNALNLSRRQQHRLVTDASHELRTPLTSLRTNVELLQRTDDLSDDVRHQIMDDVLFELDELTALVSELVELATDQHDLGEPQEVDFAVLVDGVVRRHRRRTDLVLNADLAPCRIRVIPVLAERAVSNLLANAVKWSPAGGQIDVTVRDGSLWVRDYGPGIAEGEREAVFERFYRADAARSSPGSGLGLSIVRDVADAFDGQAVIVDTVGDGTTAMLSFPTL